MQQNQREIRETFEIELDNNGTKINTVYIFHCYNYVDMGCGVARWRGHILTLYFCCGPPLLICLPTHDQTSSRVEASVPAPAAVSHVRPLHVSVSSSENVSWSCNVTWLNVAHAGHTTHDKHMSEYEQKIRILPLKH